MLCKQATSDGSLAFCLQEDVAPVGKGWGNADKTEDDAYTAHTSSGAHPLHAAPGMSPMYARCMCEKCKATISCFTHSVQASLKSGHSCNLWATQSISSKVSLHVPATRRSA